MFGGIATGIAGAAVGAICIAVGNLAFVVIGAAPLSTVRRSHFGQPEWHLPSRPGSDYVLARLWTVCSALAREYRAAVLSSRRSFCSIVPIVPRRCRAKP